MPRRCPTSLFVLAMGLMVMAEFDLADPSAVAEPALTTGSAPQVPVDISLPGTPVDQSVVFVCSAGLGGYIRRFRTKPDIKESTQWQRHWN